MPKFTVGIPCYNQAEYLPDAIESALSQTVPCEVIVVVDGSPDNAYEVSSRYGVKVIYQVNKGLASARNTAIMNMAGDYFLPLDADDILIENCIERMTEAANQYNTDVIAPSFKMFGVNNAEVILQGIPTMEDLKEANRIGYFSAIKKSVLLEIGGYNPKMVWGWEDYDLWLDIFKRNHSLAILQDILVLYRTKDHSMIHDANAHAPELWAQIKRNHPSLWPSS